MSEPPNKQRTLTDFLSAAQVRNEDTSCRSVTINVSGKSITAIATGDSASSSVNCSPNIVLPSEPSRRQENEIRFPSDIAQSTADEPLLACFPNTIIGGKTQSCQLSWF